MKPIYKPKGAALEYVNGDGYALNIYTGCPHRCYYCFAPTVLRRDREKFHSDVRPREGIVEAVRRQAEREQITGQLIHLCFTCDPYPAGYDTTPTREIIKILKESGNHVQILTKGDGSRDFDLLDENDWYGVTISCSNRTAKTAEPHATSPYQRLASLKEAKQRGICTWASFEPVLSTESVLSCIWDCAHFIDRAKIGKLNYWPSDINWAEFGRKVEALCEEIGIDYYIKDSLRKEMEKS